MKELTKSQRELVKNAQQNLLKDLAKELDGDRFDNWNDGLMWVSGYIKAVVSLVPGTYSLWDATRDEALKMIDRLEVTIIK
jgi:hypothetical protein